LFAHDGVKLIVSTTQELHASWAGVGLVLLPLHGFHDPVVAHVSV
jgi:hypothetical protein